jgi:L-ascorbate metabolism protein UlaG (beta-lactamase superfamily)
VITHDHWDHLDYETVTKLLPKVKQVITGLGTGEHLEYWGFEPSKIIELDWFESQDLGNGFKINAEPARHFTGRGLKETKQFGQVLF